MDLSIFSQINWIAVVVATLAYFLAGEIWYHKKVFGTKWAQSHGIDLDDPEAKRGMGTGMVMAFITFAVITIALSVLIVKLNLTLFISGVKLGLITGIGFSWATIYIAYLYSRKPSSVHFIDGLYHVAAQIIAAGILCSWR